ncbi:MAG: hypothetical protein JWQ31_2717 [Mycobacterium sp.]|nr:hypothetical protein [Mycobacterium sp.]
MNVEMMQQSRRRRHRSGRGSAWQGPYRDPHLDAGSRVHDAATQEGSDDVMMPLTPGAQIDELRRLLRESEQRRQAAEVKLADRERQLGTARQTIATQDHRIGGMTAELARLRGAATATVLNAYALDFPHLFKSTAER